MSEDNVCGKYVPVVLIPKDPNPEAMYFSEDLYPGNVPEIIAWLGDAFYALTTGKEVTIRNSKIKRMAPEGMSSMENLVIVIDNGPDGLVVAVPGDWIIKSETKGFTTVTKDVFEQNWVMIEPSK